MKSLFIFTLYLISGGSASYEVTGHSGGGVLIKCKYDKSHISNSKYFCKISTLNCVTQIRTEVKNTWENRGRFSLFDNTKTTVLWVLIRELTVEDSGTYQCGVANGSNLNIYTLKKLLTLTVNKNNINALGHVGGSLNISCKYPQHYKGKPKFLCRKVDIADCAYKISSSSRCDSIRRWKTVEKFSLCDDKEAQIFTVSINNLTEEDSGEYWCGAKSGQTSGHRYNVHITQTNLKVTDPDVLSQSSTHIGSPTTKPTTLSTSKTTSPSSDAKEPAFPVLVSVILVLLLIGFLFIILTLRKRSKNQNPISFSSQSLRDPVNICGVGQASDTAVSTVYSTSQLLTNPSDPVYDNLQLPMSDFLHSAAISAEDPAYATVKFRKNVCSSNNADTFNKEDDFCDYATVKHVFGT
ncbi:CMRF35-like molecule 8 [Salminus brasiliensis]|uniref:CMRF35-like molecule 8 n=1 Tax=Salminus brasiliensis TaxID=930266 RepID=UPI003B83825D